MAPDLHELIGQAPPESGIADNLLQFGIEILIAAGPVNVGVDVGEEKGHKVWEIPVEDLLPGAIVAHGNALFPYRREERHGVGNAPIQGVPRAQG